MQCAYCGQEHPDGTQFCPRTGKKIMLAGRCPACGQPVDPAWQHCGYCGQKLIQPEGNPVQQPVQAAGYPQVGATTPGPSETRRGTSRWSCLLIAGGVIVALIIGIVVWLNAVLSGPMAEVAARMTAAAWTVTPSTIPTATVTHTPMPTVTPSPTATLSFAPPPLAEGWQGYTVSGFYVAMPDEWKSVDVDKEGVQAILNAASSLSTEWAQYIKTMVSTEDAQKMLKFWAYDTKPAGNYYANANVVFQSGTVPLNVNDVCVEIPPAYAKMGIEVRDKQCGLVINTLDAAQVTSRYVAEAYTVIEKQYFYVRGGDYWILTLTVEESQWEQYQPVFDAISETFMVSP